MDPTKRVLGIRAGADITRSAPDMGVTMIVIV